MKKALSWELLQIVIDDALSITGYVFFLDSGSETTGGEQLNMEQMAGIFIVFAVGIGLGLVCMVFEYIFAASSDSFRDHLDGVRIAIIVTKTTHNKPISINVFYSTSLKKMNSFAK